MRQGTLHRACPRCGHELPQEGTTDDYIIAVLGAKDAGKTHYLATLYHVLAEAREPVGGEVWEVAFDETTRESIRGQLWRPLFKDKQELPITTAKSELRLPLRHRPSDRRVLVTFQDLSGEILSNQQKLAKEDFLHHARGVILLADPLAFESPNPKGRWSKWYHGHPTCTEILASYQRILENRAQRVQSREEQAERHLLPAHKVLTVAVTKADLVLRNRSHPFWNGTSAAHLMPGYWNQRKEESQKAKKWLLERAGRELERLALSFADVGYFFVSSYGYEHKPKTKDLVKPPNPVRVHEPLFALLDRLAQGDPGSTERVAAERKRGAEESPLPEVL
jgi:Double-GTPase 2